MTALWITVGVLAALLIGALASMFLLLAMGRLHLDLGWGRSVHALGPITIRIAAPRDLVFEIINAPYAGRAGSGSGVEVIAGDGALVVAAHNTKVHFYTARTVEVVEFEPPGRVAFKHLTGPVPAASEQFTLADVDEGTELLYSGEFGVDFFVLGRIAGRHWVRPQWERSVREHLDDLKARAEARAARAQARAARTPQAGG
jgi:Polyketide cyclase / dehydrase and lipid transport